MFAGLYISVISVKFQLCINVRLGIIKLIISNNQQDLKGTKFII